MAAPHVTGIASLLKGYNPSLFNDDIENIIKLSADDVNSAQYPGWDQYLGTGRVNARRALEYLRAPYVLTQTTATGGSDLGASDYYLMTIYGAPGLSDGSYRVKRHEVRRSVSFSPTTWRAVWGRGVATVGWADEGNTNFTMGWCDVVPGTVTSTSATLRTFVYEVWGYNILGQTWWIGWYPTTPQNVVFAYTVLGRLDPLSVSISGPEWVPPKVYRDYTANVSGGSGNVSYQWYKDAQALGTAQQQSVYTGTSSFTVQVNVHDNSTNENASASLYVVNDFEGGIKSPETADPLKLLIPTEFSLGQNYPNPFNPETQIAFGLPEPAVVTITISDLLGREVAKIASAKYSAGYHSVRWAGLDASGSKVGTGIYFYRINAVGESGKSFTKVIKMALTK